MELLHAVTLALIQGITEFLPISSSAHLILLPSLVSWPDQGLAFDVALNCGTTLALCIYLRRDLAAIVGAIKPSTRGTAWASPANKKIFWMLCAATVPVALAGFFFHDLVGGSLRSVRVIAWSSIVWGVVLWVFDRRPGTTPASGVGWLTAMIVGLAQAIAIVPGTSRSGITITAGLMMGLTRSAAARFSFLLAVPIGIIAGAYEIKKLLEDGAQTPWLMVSIGFIISFVAAYLTIHFFLKLVARTSLSVFVAYRIALGILLLLFL